MIKFRFKSILNIKTQSLCDLYGTLLIILVSFIFIENKKLPDFQSSY